LFIQQEDVPFYENTCSLGKLDEKLNHKKNSKFWNFERKGDMAKDSFFNHLAEKICLMGSKCLALGVTHMSKK
jgi:hypothetical protein